MRVFERQARNIFSPTIITRQDSDLAIGCDRVLLMFQAVSLTIVAGGMIVKLRREHEQMEGLASMMLKVAFIATIPFWRTFTIDTADAIANAIGYESVGSANAPSPVMARMWDLLNQWVPPSTPYLDALQSQSADNVPASGMEQSWALQAWNWARGVTATGSSTFDAIWPAVTGGLRAFWIHVCCEGMACLVVVMIILTYLMEIFRYLLLYAGCALLPVFIAGMGLEILRSQSLKYVFGLLSVACWPIGWALANVVTVALIQGVTGWMGRLSAAALGLSPSATSIPPVAVAAPNLAWGIIVLFVGVTLALCVWCFVVLFLIPLTIGRAVAAGAQVAGVAFASGGGGSATSWPPRRSEVHAGTAASGSTLLARMFTGRGSAPSGEPTSAGAGGLGPVVAPRLRVGGSGSDISLPGLAPTLSRREGTVFAGATASLDPAPGGVGGLQGRGGREMIPASSQAVGSRGAAAAIQWLPKATRPPSG